MSKVSQTDTIKSQIDQFEKDNVAKIYADASNDVYQVGKAGGAPAPKCLERIDVTNQQVLDDLQKQLGLQEPLRPQDFYNESEGYRAQLYKDHRTGHYIVAFRGTEKNTLKDWTNNVNNQKPDAGPEDAPSYFNAAKLGGLLGGAKPPVDFTGHSKGGGEAYEAMSRSPSSQAFVFNPAAPSPRVTDAERTSVSERTENYTVKGEVLSLLQRASNTNKQQIKNAQWLREQLDSGYIINLKYIDSIDEERVNSLNKRISEGCSWLHGCNEDGTAAKLELEKRDKEFKKKKNEFIAQLDKQISDAKLADSSGESVHSFGQVIGRLRPLPSNGSENDTPGTMALARHAMDAAGAGFVGVIPALETAKTNGMTSLQNFVRDVDNATPRVIGPGTTSQSR